LFCFVIKSKGQNLVPNPSFEFNDSCKNAQLIHLLGGWCSVGGKGGISGYFNPCLNDIAFNTPVQYNMPSPCIFSYQIPHSGKSYVDLTGLIPSSPSTEGNYPFVKLLDTLQANKTYCVTYYVSLWNYCNYSIDKLGALLTPTPFACWDGSTPSVSMEGIYTPQVVSPTGFALEDTLNWMEISGAFTATGTEAYLTLGNFYTNAQHFIKNSYPTNCNGVAEYYLDDVSVEEVQLAKCKNDTSICPTDSVLIGNNVSEATAYSWQPTNGLSCNTCANPKASPSITTIYTLTKTQCKAVTTASITVTIKTDCTPKGAEALEAPNVFTPNNDGVNDTFMFNIIGDVSNVSFMIYNRWGLEIQTTTLKQPTTFIWDGRTTSGIECSDGVYFYVLEYTDANGDTQKKNGYVSLFR
jgi:gliding motility-associated-like protein